MFQALKQASTALLATIGNEQSSAEQNDWGFHVLRVVANSPAANAGLEPWFDYICGVNSTKIDSTNAHLLSSTVQSAAQQKLPVTFTIYSAKGQSTRDVYVEPTEELGVSLRWCPLSSSGKVWHVLDVHPSSPAEIAGFIPFSDFIIGSPEGALSAGEGALGELVEEFLRRPLRLWVYNSTHDIVRVVTIVPDRSWGGEGALGFNIGYGLLHRIPAVSNDAVVFDSEVPMQTAFQLAQQTQLPPTEDGQSRPPIQRKSSEMARPAHGRRRLSHSAGAAGKKVSGIEDILREGQEKSAKEDFIPTKAVSSPDIIPPPPKRHSPVEQQPRLASP